jgi:hypothetical protein
MNTEGQIFYPYDFNNHRQIKEISVENCFNIRENSDIKEQEDVEIKLSDNSQGKLTDFTIGL